MIYRVFNYDSEQNIQVRGNSYEIARTNILPFLIENAELMEELHKMQLNMMDEYLNEPCNLQQYTKMVNLYKLYKDEIVRVFNKECDDYIDQRNKEIADIDAKVAELGNVSKDDEESYKAAMQSIAGFAGTRAHLIQQIEMKNAEKETMKHNVIVYETECTSYAARLEKLRKERTSVDSNIITEKFDPRILELK